MSPGWSSSPEPVRSGTAIPTVRSWLPQPAWAAFQSKGGPLLALLPGDSVTFAPGEVHWHGVAPGQLFVHTSIQAADAQGEQATWLHAVSEEDYAHDPE